MILRTQNDERVGPHTMFGVRTIRLTSAARCLRIASIDQVRRLELGRFADVVRMFAPQITFSESGPDLSMMVASVASADWFTIGTLAFLSPRKNSMDYI